MSGMWPLKHTPQAPQLLRSSAGPQGSSFCPQDNLSCSHLWGKAGLSQQHLLHQNVGRIKHDNRGSPVRVIGVFVALQLRDCPSKAWSRGMKSRADGIALLGPCEPGPLAATTRGLVGQAPIVLEPACHRWAAGSTHVSGGVRGQWTVTALTLGRHLCQQVEAGELPGVEFLPRCSIWICCSVDTAWEFWLWGLSYSKRWENRCLEILCSMWTGPFKVRFAFIGTHLKTVDSQCCPMEI